MWLHQLTSSVHKEIVPFRILLELKNNENCLNSMQIETEIYQIQLWLLSPINFDAVLIKSY